MEKGKLTDKQAAFVREYVKDWNGTQAAIRAGYSSKTANEQAARMLAKAHVQEAVEAQRQAVGEAALVDSVKIVKTLENMAYGDLRQVMEWGPGGVKLKDSSGLSTDAAQLVVEVSESVNQAGFKSLRLKRVDPQRALEQLAAYDPKRPAGRREVSGPGGKAIEINTKTWLDVMNEDDGEA